MKYVCLRCHRTIEWNEELSFCPFCGNGYRTTTQAQSASTMKIVMGSDSEKTIQEKYWKRSRDAVSDALSRLRASLPRFSKISEERASQQEETPQKYKTQLLPTCELSELERCTSVTGFRSRMKKILENVEKECQVNLALMEFGKKIMEEDRKISAERKAAMERGEWSVEELEDEYSIDIDAEKAFIQQFCMELAENLGSMAPDRLQPELDYEPDDADWLNDEEDDENPTEYYALFPDYVSLWKEIQSSASVLIAALESNGLFALTMVHGEVSEDFDPKQCAKELQQLKNGDYDPLFGESPESFIRTFFDGLANLMEYINELPGYAEIMEWSPEQKMREMKERLDEIKLEALKNLIRRWSKILALELDRLYQSQSEDMMNVCSGIETLGKRLNEKE